MEKSSQFIVWYRTGAFYRIKCLDRNRWRVYKEQHEFPRIDKSVVVLES